MPTLTTIDKEITETLARSSLSEKEYNNIVAKAGSVTEALQLGAKSRVESEEKKRKVQDEINAFNQEEDKIQKQKIAEILTKKKGSEEKNSDGSNKQIDVNLIEFHAAEVKLSPEAVTQRLIEKFFEKHKEAFNEVVGLGKKVHDFNAEMGLVGDKEALKPESSFVEQQEKYVQKVQEIKAVVDKPQNKEFLREYSSLLQMNEVQVKSNLQGQAVFNSLEAMICLMDYMNSSLRRQDDYSCSQELVFAKRLMQLNTKNLDLGYQIKNGF